MHDLFKENTSAYAKKIGSMLWWSIPKVSVTRHTLLADAKANNLPEKYIPSEISVISAFKRSIDQVRQGLDKSDGILIRQLDNKDNLIIRAIVQETIKNQKAYHQQLGTISLDRKNGTLSYSQETADDGKFMSAINKIYLAFEECKNYGTNDIRAVITAFCKDCAISLRESGGIYFVPIIHEKTLKQVIGFLADVCPKASLYVKPEYIIDDSDLLALREIGKSEMAKEIAELEQMGRALETELSGLYISDVRGNAKKQNKITDVLQEYADAKSRVDAFSRTLNFKGEELHRRIMQLQAGLKKECDRLQLKVDISIERSLDEMIGDMSQADIPIAVSAMPQKQNIDVTDAINLLDNLLEDF